MTSMGPDRDLIGYGEHPPHPKWPNEASIAVQFVINYEEGGENCPLYGDPASEAFLSDIVGAQPWPGKRHVNMESMYEYGSRAGFWRLYRLFTERQLPVTVYGVTQALKLHPEAVAAMQRANWEIASHGLRWFEYKDYSKDEERAHMSEAISTHQELTGERPLGWYTGRCSENTLDLVMEEGGFLYAADSYADDLPYWVARNGKTQLIVPYTLDLNDSRFVGAPGYAHGGDFYDYLKLTFEFLLAEGRKGAPKMMSVGLHNRLVGRPGRAAGLAKFLDLLAGYEDVWVPRRIDIARHWHAHHPCALDGQCR